MKRKLLSLLALLCLTVASAWADSYFFLEVDGTSATLMYGDFDPSSGKPYYAANESGIMEWRKTGTYYDEKKSIRTVSVDASCRIFTGTTLKGFFSYWTALTTINYLGNLNTSNVTNMGYMFTGCQNMTLLDLNSLDTSNVTNMSIMFDGCSNLETLDLSSWNTSNVTDMGYMFRDCKKLMHICVGNGWSTSKAGYGTLMFAHCTCLPNYNKDEVHIAHAHTGAGGYLSFKLTANEGKTGEYWATYYSNVTNYQASSQVFMVNLTGTAITMTEISDGIVNSSQGVVLKSTSASIIMTPSNDASAGTYTGNSLTGTTSSITNPGNAFVLNKGTNGVGFYKLSSRGTIGANKAYLTYAGALAREFFLFDDDATSINEELGMKNEELYEGAIYNVAGQHIQKMQRGINIVNGKKIIK